MKNTTRILVYIIPLVALIATMWTVFIAGKGLEHITLNPASAVAKTAASGTPEIISALQHPLAIFILQIILIITASQICGFLFRKIGQPSVMGEIVAGILLGPSLIGGLYPQFTAFVFPPSSLGNLQMLSQIGLILFMFVIGIELDMNLFKKKAGSAIMVSYFGMIIPFALGLGLAYLLYQQYAPANIHFYSFALFIGIALSITAFPVLARIIKERGITNTRLGTVSIAAAAAGDVAAWCMLTFIVAIAKAASINSAVYTIIALVAYIGVMLLLVKPLLAKMAERSIRDNNMKRSSLAMIFVVLLLSSYCCEVMGIHALFGAFFAGVILPRQNDFQKILVDKIEDVSMVLLLPMFFVFTGLRTQVGLLNEAHLWATCVLVIAVAVIGKFGGSAIAARVSGETLKDSISIGALMNTRGLVELIVLNIGYDLGILSPKLFTMMVIMALVTTLMTNPSLNIINRVMKEG